MITMRSRARGCLLGQLGGDSLGSLVEFKGPDQIATEWPDGLWELADGGTWNTIAGQPTDDSEMALVLARMLVERRVWDGEGALKAYMQWFDTNPFDMGNTIRCGLQGSRNVESQANGAMMRISPLGILGVNHPLELVSKWAMADARITHPNLVCVHANALYVRMLVRAIQGTEPEELYRLLVRDADEMRVGALLKECITKGEQEMPADFTSQAGWVLIAFQNTLYQLLHASDFADGVVDTVMRGGDTDTTAAIAGALLGAVYGEESIPEQWREAILHCRPEKGKEGVHRPRPEIFWPVDALQLADALLMD